MSFRLPLASSPIRELFDVMDLVPVGQPGGALKLPTVQQAIRLGRACIEAHPGVRDAFYIVLQADGNVSLMRVGPRAHNIVWVFGPAVGGVAA